MNFAKKMSLATIVVAYIMLQPNAATTGATKDPRSITNSPVNPTSDGTVDPRSITASPVKDVVHTQEIPNENGESKNLDTKGQSEYNKDVRSSNEVIYKVILADNHENNKKEKRDGSSTRADNSINSNVTNEKIENHQERVLDKNDPNKRDNAGDSKHSIPSDTNTPPPHQGEVLKNGKTENK